MTKTFNEEILTAFALDELDPAQRSEIEDALETDSDMEARIDEIRKVARLSASALSGGTGEVALTDEQRGKVMERAKGKIKGEALFEAGDDIEIDLPEDPVPEIRSSKTGTGDESSILFSLNNLQALASTSDGPDGDDAASAGAIGAGEVSGLVDIRSMAEIRDSQALIIDDDFLAMDDVGFGANMGAPVLPPSQRGEGMSAGAKIGIGLGAAAIAACVAIILVVTMKSGSEKDASSAQEQQIALLMKQLEDLKESGGSEQQVAAMQAQLDKAEQAKAEGDEDEGPEDEGADKKVSKKASKSSSKASGSGKGSSSKGSSSKGASASGSSGSSKKSGGKKVSELDDLLGGSASGSPKKKKESKPAAASGGSLPKTLTRSQVQSGMRAVAPSVKRCGGGSGGSIAIQVTIAGTGRVTSAVPTGPHAGTTLGQCAARAVKRARFPRFSNPTLKVKYPFKL